jgi:hypothetical protein
MIEDRKYKYLFLELFKANDIKLKTSKHVKKIFRLSVSKKPTLVLFTNCTDSKENIEVVSPIILPPPSSFEIPYKGNIIKGLIKTGKKTQTHSIGILVQNDINAEIKEINGGGKGR